MDRAAQALDTLFPNPGLNDSWPGLFSGIHALDPFGAPSLGSCDQIGCPADLSNKGSNLVLPLYQT